MTSARCTVWVLVSALLGLGGCVALPRPEAVVSKAPKAPADFPQRIAVFPVSNKAGEPDGAIILRAFAIRKLGKDIGFLIQAPDDTDAIIRDRTLSGPEIPVQVAIAKMDARTLTTWLGVDGVLHGELIAYRKAKLSVYVRSQVKAHFWLTDGKGNTIWDAEKDSDHGSIGGGSGGSAGLESILVGSGIPNDTINRIRGSDLAPVAFDVVDDAFATFPRRE
jgi:hypothetical protein